MSSPSHSQPTALDTTALAHLIEQVSRVTYALAFTEGLNPAQWAALRYFHRADDRARTVSGFARAQSTTPGTASRTISALIRRGLLDRQTDPEDRRRALIQPTLKGHKMLEGDPMGHLVGALEHISPAERGVVSEVMTRLLYTLQTSQPTEDTVGEGADTTEHNEDSIAASLSE